MMKAGTKEFGELSGFQKHSSHGEQSVKLCNDEFSGCFQLHEIR